MSLQQVAERCRPPTTPQTIGRLETGARNVSVHWLNRIAEALGVEAADLVQLPHREDLPLTIILDANGPRSPRRQAVAIAPRPAADSFAMKVESSLGDYRSGDEVWLKRLPPEDYSSALNRDVLVPRPGDRFAFGRLIGREGHRLQLIALDSGRRQIVINSPPWIAVAQTLIRAL